MSNLRDFIYLDTAKLNSFVSQIGEGLVSQINETIRKHGGISADVNVGIPGFGGKVGTGKETENERQQTLQLTEPAYFNVLYQYLESEKMLQKITGSNLEKRGNLKEGQFVEINGIAEPPAVEAWLTRVKDLMNFIDRNIKLFGQSQGKNKGKNNLSRQQLDLFKGMLNFLEDYIKISRKDPEKQYVRVSSNEQVFLVWCGVIPNYAATPLEVVLPAEVSIVGRVEKLLGEGQVYKIVDLKNFNQSSGNIKKLFEALNALGPMIGQREITEKDLQASYPDIFITPIAIYR